VRWWGIGLAVAAGIVSTLVIADRWNHGHDVSPALMCQSNLGHIGRACMTYAEGHGGQMPTSLELLTEGGRQAYLQPKQLICPLCGRAYDYIPGHTLSDPPDSVVAYEPLSNHEGRGGNILRLDGSVKWFKPAEYRQVMTKAAQATRPATQPASAPVSDSRPSTAQ
jgi:prepilin-type processing-associated H-X9-DG protein